MTNKQIQKGSVSSRFTEMIIKEVSSTTDIVKFDNYKKKLCQHMFIKIDAQLKSLEAKRIVSGKTNIAAYEWSNINMNKLAIDTMHRVELGLDALIPNHIWPIPYFNKKISKYDLDLRIGYIGKDYYRRKMSVVNPSGITYELVYSNDLFVPIKKSINQLFDSYKFEIKNPFDRGEIIGGFGYIRYPQMENNVLVLVPEKEFIKSKNLAKSKDFWNKNPSEMRYKTLIHRTTEKLLLDPEKINSSFLAVEDSVDDSSDIVKSEIDQNANKQQLDMPNDSITNVETTIDIVPNLVSNGDRYRVINDLSEKEKQDIIDSEIAEMSENKQDQPDF